MYLEIKFYVKIYSFIPVNRNLLYVSSVFVQHDKLSDTKLNEVMYSKNLGLGLSLGLKTKFNLLAQKLPEFRRVQFYPRFEPYFMGDMF